MHILSYFLFSLHLDFKEEIRYYLPDDRIFLSPRTNTFPDVAARKAARKKVIEQARELERESYKAMMQKRRQLQTSYQLDTIA